MSLQQCDDKREFQKVCGEMKLKRKSDLVQRKKKLKSIVLSKDAFCMNFMAIFIYMDFRKFCIKTNFSNFSMNFFLKYPGIVWKW